MSALGAVPGYAYPSFDYSNSEFAELLAPAQTFAVAGNPAVDVAVAEDGNALYIREVRAQLIASAAVGTRSFSLTLFDSDGNVGYQMANPVTVAANGGINAQWSIGISTGFVVSNFGFAPIAGIVIPTGWKWSLFVLGAQIGDQLGVVTSLGLRIPNTPSDELNIPPVTRPLFV